jgi:Na+-driven multidrug efflux pump
MFAQSSTGLIELWFIARLGTDALTAMSLVTPVLLLMQNMSLSAMGGGISSAVARALGAGDRGKADSMAFHAVVINGTLGLLFTIIILAVARPLYRFLGGEGASLEGAVLYSNLVFVGMILLWASSALASVIRGPAICSLQVSSSAAGPLYWYPCRPASSSASGRFLPWVSPEVGPRS